MSLFKQEKKTYGYMAKATEKHFAPEFTHDAI